MVVGWLMTHHGGNCKHVYELLQAIVAWVVALPWVYYLVLGVCDTGFNGKEVLFMAVVVV